MSIPKNTTRHPSLVNLFSTHQSFSPPKKLLPTISQHRQIKKNLAKELTQAIAKFHTTHKKQSNPYSQEILRNSLYVLKSFSQVDNNFQQLFLQMFYVFKRFTFVLDDHEVIDVLEQFGVKGANSYRKCFLYLYPEITKTMQMKIDQVSKLEEKLLEVNEEYRFEKAKWKKQNSNLKGQIEKLKKMSNPEYVRSLQEKVQNQKQAISDLQTQNNYLDKEIQNHIIQLDRKDSEIHELKFEVVKLKQKIYDLHVRKQKIESYFQNLRDRFDELLGTMMGLKENIQKVQNENEILVSERAKLAKRAAVSFDDLTPRPKYQQKFVFPQKAHIHSTTEIFDKLYQITGMQPKQLVSKVFVRKKNRKLIETQAIRSKVMEEIIISKQKLNQIQEHSKTE